MTKKIKRKSGPCLVEGCGIKARRYGYCSRHASRFRKHGDPLVNKKRIRGKCSLDECNSPHYMKSYCLKHYQRWKKRGDPHSLGQAPHHSGWIQHGYRMIKINGVIKSEHRRVMESHLGRTLLKGEVVHHINEDTIDNRIGNLQLMSESEHKSHHMKLYWAKKKAKK